MITKVITDYLDNPNIDLNKKYEYIRKLKLSYSDIFKLIELYKWDYNICHMLSPFVSYKDSKMEYKMKKEIKEDNQRKRRQRKIKKLRSEKEHDQY